MCSTEVKWYITHTQRAISGCVPVSNAVVFAYDRPIVFLSCRSGVWVCVSANFTDVCLL
jgi:hypothetical protein